MQKNTLPNDCKKANDLGADDLGAGNATKVARVAAIVPTYNRWSKTERFLQHFSQQTYVGLSIVVVDANSPDGTADRVRQLYPGVTLIQVDEQQYWAGATNAGVRYALSHDHDYILTINDDAVVSLDHVQRLMTLAQDHHLQILGNRIDYLHPSDKVWALGTQLTWGTPNFLRLQHSGMKAGDLPIDLMAQDIVAVDTLPGDGVLIHRSVFETIGLYQNIFLPHYHADSELVLRARRYGFQAYVAAHVVLQDDFFEEQKKQDFESLSGLKHAFFHPKSHLFAPAVVYIFLRYCPWWAYLTTVFHLLNRLLHLSEGRLRTEGAGR